MGSQKASKNHVEKNHRFWMAKCRPRGPKMTQNDPKYEKNDDKINTKTDVQNVSKNHRKKDGST